MNDNQIEITKKMRDSVEVYGDDSHKVIEFTSHNGSRIEILDEGANPDSQVISLTKHGKYNDNAAQTIQFAVADFDLIVELMQKPLKPRPGSFEEEAAAYAEINGRVTE